jgi:hypothetical protein
MPPLLLPASSSFSSVYDDDHPLARDMMDYIDLSPDPFHAVRNAVVALEKGVFEEWRDDDEKSYDECGGICGRTTTIRPGGKYYFTREVSARGGGGGTTGGGGGEGWSSSSSFAVSSYGGGGRRRTSALS